MKEHFSIKNTTSSMGSLAQSFDVVILGAGAAGLMCALTAAKRGRSVVLVEHNAHVGRKITVSGGGKANFTNLFMHSDFFFGADTSFTEPALESFSPKAILDFFVQQGLPFEERDHGQLFGCASAQLFVNALEEKCRQKGCVFMLEHTLTHVAHEKELFAVTCTSKKDGKVSYLLGKSLVLALGSPAWAQVGATQDGLPLAAQWGHKAKPFSPVLTSLLMPTHWPLAGLSGISLPVNVRVEKAVTNQMYTHTEALLFTHTGISGPAVLQASCHWQEGKPIYIDFLPHMHLEELLDAPECGKLFVRNLLCKHMPQRLVDKLLPEEWARRKIAELSRKVRKSLHESVHAFSIVPEKKGGMHKAEAARGGILTEDVNAWSMESLLQERLFIVGELLDITGQLGGYNLHWAFASGHLAGQHV